MNTQLQSIEYLRMHGTNQFAEHSAPGCDDGMLEGIQEDCGLHQDRKNAGLWVARKSEYSQASLNLSKNLFVFWEGAYLHVPSHFQLMACWGKTYNNSVTKCSEEYLKLLKCLDTHEKRSLKCANLRALYEERYVKSVIIAEEN